MAYGKIFARISRIAGQIGAVGKNGRSERQGYPYRSAEDIINALSPLLSEHGVFVVPDVIDWKREDRVTSKGSPVIYTVVTVKYTFWADDGSAFNACTVGEAMDSGDKATGKAMTNAYKAVLSQVFAIPTQTDAPDPDRGQANQIDSRQAAELTAALQKSGVVIPKLLEMYGASSIGELTKAKYEDILKKLEAKGGIT